jgi:hypothetical protein
MESVLAGNISIQVVNGFSPFKLSVHGFDMLNTLNFEVRSLKIPTKPIFEKNVLHRELELHETKNKNWVFKLPM